jgi:hypothetical protein
MCCFSATGWRKKIEVSATKIFARMTSPGVQALVYSMNLSSKIDVAMVLPIPVVPRSGEDAVKFVDLTKHASMFADLEALFDDPLPSNGGLFRGGFAPQSRLVVHDVGAFIASYVPSQADFQRLDKRFRMPKVLFDSVPAYADYGFAVFQLKPGKHTIQPMAFEFPTRESRLFFPTVHLHDGKWRAQALFDHALYFQHASEQGDQLSVAPPAKDYEGLADRESRVARITIKDVRANADTWVG